MEYVCLLLSLSNPDKRYVGICANFPERLKQQNAGWGGAGIR